MSATLLSVCIPTYNRAPFLRILLESICAALPPNPRGIEFLISDNAGTDNTPDVIAEFQDRLPMIRYSRNETNLGAEGNLLKLVDASCGKYIWLFGDDDLMRPCAFDEILPELTRDADYYVLNYGTVKKDGVTLSSDTTFSLLGNRDLDDKNYVLSQFGVRLGLLTCVLLRRNTLLQVPRPDFVRLAPTGLSFLYAALSAAATGKGRYIARPTFNYRAGNSEHSPTAEHWTQTYGVNLRAVMAEAEQRLGFSHRAMRRFHRGMVKEPYAIIILLDRISGRPTAPYYRSLVRDYGDVPLSYLLLFTILIPAWGAKAIRHTWQKRALLRQLAFRSPAGE